MKSVINVAKCTNQNMTNINVVRFIEYSKKVMFCFIIME